MPKKVQIHKASQEELLETRFCDLAIDLKKSPISKCLDRIVSEFQKKNFYFRPHFWVAQEWFVPEGIPGIAIPFYLCHKKLTELHCDMGLETEGDTVEECMKLLRHEAGHAYDNAYRLRRLRERQRLFGLASTPYPKEYQPQKNSRKFVHHLPDHYAQSHPDEDWAETFAVWLTPRSQWKKIYANKPVALKKLQLMDTTMKEIKRKRPLVFNRETDCDIRQNQMKLKTYYKIQQRKQQTEMLSRQMVNDLILASQSSSMDFLLSQTYKYLKSGQSIISM